MAPEGKPPHAVTLESVQQAAERIAQYAHRTPVRPPSCRLLRTGVMRACSRGCLCCEPRRGLTVLLSCAALVQVMTCSAIDGMAGFSTVFKCEQFQKGCACSLKPTQSLLAHLL
jgi:hypothetical protein